MTDAFLRHSIMSSSCVDDPMTSEGGLLLASVAMTSEGNAVNDVSDKGLQLPSSEPKQETMSAVKPLWAVSVTPTPPIETPETPGNADLQPVAATTAALAHTSRPLNMTTMTTTSGVNRTEDKGHPERKRRRSNDSHDSSTKMSESAVDDNRDDDEDNDDDDDETKLSSPDIDPERLKAFNLFVRLFIDENLDRSVPISKQPKDKIQAILEACDRQFAEFHDRARKRIRTYLKSCRRLRRSKEGATMDQIRPTPPHLTSAIAESILAQACENESNNAKRMRMGLEPLPAVSAPGPTGGSTLVSQKSSPPPSSTGGVVGLPPQPPPPPHRAPFPFPKLERASPVVLPQGLSLAPPPPPTETEKLRGGIAPAGAPHPNCYDAQALCYPTSAGPTTVPRSAYPTGYQRPAHYHHHHHHHQNTTTTATTTPLTNNNNSSNNNNNNNNSQLQNGPTDLSLKSSNNSTSSSGKNQLNSSEMSTIRQLIAGYRESAAFLFRSADELEQLLIHHK